MYQKNTQIEQLADSENPTMINIFGSVIQFRGIPYFLFQTL